MGWHRHDLRRVAATSNVGGEPIVTIDFQLAVRRTIDAVALYVANAAIARIQFGYLDATTPVLGDLVHTFALAAIATPTTEARWIRLRTPHQAGSVVRVRLTLATDADWLLVSEVRFERDGETTAAAVSLIDALDIDAAGAPAFTAPNGDGGATDLSLTYISIERETAAGDTDERTLCWLAGEKTMMREQRRLFALFLGLIAAFVFGSLSLCALLHLLCSNRRYSADRLKRAAPQPPRRYAKLGAPSAIFAGSSLRSPYRANRYTTEHVKCALVESEEGVYAEPYGESLTKPLKRCDESSNSSYVAAESVESDGELSPIAVAAASAPSSSSPLPLPPPPPHPLSSSPRFDALADRLSKSPIEFDQSRVTLVATIGVGCFGELAVGALDGDEQAKVLLRSTTTAGAGDSKRERQALAQLSHQNVCRLLGTIAPPRDGRCTSVFEFPRFGALPQLLRSNERHVSTLHTLSLCEQLAAALAYLEAARFVHRDVAARNCWIEADGVLKLANVASADARFVDDYARLANGRVLALRWLAPECLHSFDAFSSASDTWALGVTLVEIYVRCAQRPFDDLDDAAVVRRLDDPTTTPPPPLLPRPQRCPMELYERVMLACWQREPTRRPTLAELHRRLQNLQREAVA